MEAFTFDACTQTLTITSKFNEQLSDTESAEYQLLQRYRQDFPALQIVRRTHRTPSRYITKSGDSYKCNQFKHLTFERMERFISALPDKDTFLREYTFLKEGAAAIQVNAYAPVRRWFVEQFPLFRKNPLFYLDNTPKLISAVSFLPTEQEVAS